MSTETLQSVAALALSGRHAQAVEAATAALGVQRRNVAQQLAWLELRSTSLLALLAAGKRRDE